MPAMLDDPSAPTIYRTSGAAPFPDPHDAAPQLPENIYPRQVTLRDRITAATIIPFSSQHQVPRSLLAYLSDQLNKEIEMGDTYPMVEIMSVDKFGSYWFQNFAAVMFLGLEVTMEDVMTRQEWSRDVLGSFYIKPNYPGRSSHVSNAGFLVTDAARNRGVGRLMGESYLVWAPMLGYTYSVFNLVYESNVASCRIWDALGFKRIGRVKGAGNLRSHPERLIDAIIYGRDLGPEGEDFVSEERFDKIKYYLKFGKYPAGADRAEKSRLRSAATHYKLIPESDTLMLKGKEVISDPQKQYEIARTTHIIQHTGINKCTATIAEKYHWVRIKETVSLVIKNCSQCKDAGKAPIVRPDGVIRPAPRSTPSSSSTSSTVVAAGRANMHQPPFPPGEGSVSPQVLNRTLPHPHPDNSSQDLQQIKDNQDSPSTTLPRMRVQPTAQDDYLPLDPQIMEDVRNHLGGYNTSRTTTNHPRHLSPAGHSPSGDFGNHDSDTSFQAMLGGQRERAGGSNERGEDDDGDLDMLIDDEDASGHEDEDQEGEEDDDADGDADEEESHAAIVQLQAEAAARAADEALRTVGREYGGS